MSGLNNLFFNFFFLNLKNYKTKSLIAVISVQPREQLYTYRLQRDSFLGEYKHN